MAPPESRPPVIGDGRSLAAPAFANDTGSADSNVRVLLERASRGEISDVAMARALRRTRLLATVVAVLDEVDEAGGDKDSHMAVVSMVNSAGQKGLLAFSGLDSLSGWNSQARPVPALGRDLARAAFDDEATAIVLDVAGPHRVVVEGPALLALLDDLDLDRVSALAHAALAPLTADGWVGAEVRDVRGDELEMDVLVEIRAVGGGHPDGRGPSALLAQAAELLQQRGELQRLVPGGIGVTARGAE
ncbi:MAG TPA: hypothetical protein DCQ36_08495 [Actinobacteria bacterium]|jgi:hypothetical protein|nr:hypothetical protein [Actinomycetota bacterium]